LYKKQKLDVILMDIQMPKKNGFETTIAIRKLGRSGVTPIKGAMKTHKDTDNFLVARDTQI
jgi:CheY-like chemotaxis protein